MALADGTVSLNIIHDGLLLMVLSIVMKKKLLRKKNYSAKNIYPIYDQDGQNRYPICDQTNEKTIHFGAAHTYIDLCVETLALPFS